MVSEYQRNDVCLSVNDVTKVHNANDAQRAVTALSDISFELQQGTVLGILGPNGAGKTTLIKIILGLLTPTQGSVELFGVDVHQNTKQIYRHVSAILEGNRNVYWRLTVRENLQFFNAVQGESRTSNDAIVELLNQLGLSQKADEPVRNLSRGMKQKTALGCALVQQTPILFMDEPTLGLDIGTSDRLKRQIRTMTNEEGKTVVITSHDMDVMEAVCDRVLILNDGRVVLDESTDSLKSLFDAQTYNFVVESTPEEVRETVPEKFTVRELEDQDNLTSFEVVIRSSSDFDTLIGCLYDNSIGVSSIAKIDSDLEKIFLQYTGESQIPPNQR